MTSARKAKDALDSMLHENGATATITHDGKVVAEFGLESPTPGAPSAHVVGELRRCYREAKDYAEAFGDAIKAQAEKHHLKPGALRRYIAALEGDKLKEAAEEAADLERLIEAGP